MHLVHRVVSGKWRENGYVVERPDSGALIIDPGLDTHGFTSLIAARSLKPCAIVNTHAHYDHIGSVCTLTEAYGIPFYLHKADGSLLRQANIYRALFQETEVLRIPESFSDLSGTERLSLDGFEVDIHATPGHTAGSVCFQIGDLLFTGDTLLPKGPGRVDLPGGSASDMRTSQSRLALLDDRLTVHPGHGSITTMASIRERLGDDMMRVAIEAIERALPERIVTNADLAREHPDWDMERLFVRTGVAERRIAAPDETALDLGYRACLALNEKGELKPDDIDALIFCTETPDYPIPPNSSVLHGLLNLPTRVMAFDITLACSGFVYALGIARSLVLSGTARRVLIVTADTYSRLIHPGDRSSRCLFGDGAAATIVGSGPGVEVLDIDFQTSGIKHDRFIVRAGGTRTPKSDATCRSVTDKSGNIRTAEHIEMDGLGVLSFFNTAIPRAVRDMLDRNNMKDSEIACYIFHQASLMALQGVARNLRLQPDRMVLNLTKIGNLVSASVPIALQDALNERRLKSDDKAILCGFGVGLSWATALVRMT